MIINKYGESIEINGITYAVGMNIAGTNESEYAGLNGYITEIRTDGDKNTENSGVDIHCCFEPPEDPFEVARIEDIFTDLYGETKYIEDIIFDEVIMAPEMIKPVEPNKKDASNTGLTEAILKFTFGFADRNR